MRTSRGARTSPGFPKYDPESYSGPFGEGLHGSAARSHCGRSAADHAARSAAGGALYDSDISYNDQQFGALLDLLKKNGHENDTMIVFTSDHGEEFGSRPHRAWPVAAAGAGARSAVDLLPADVPRWARGGRGRRAR